MRDRFESLREGIGPRANRNAAWGRAVTRCCLAVGVLCAIGSASCSGMRYADRRGDIRFNMGCPDATVVRSGWQRRLVATGCGQSAIYYCSYGWRYCHDFAKTLPRQVSAATGCPTEELASEEIETATWVTRGCGGQTTHRCTVGYHGDRSCTVLQPWIANVAQPTVPSVGAPEASPPPSSPPATSGGAAPPSPARDAAMDTADVVSVLAPLAPTIRACAPNTPGAVRVQVWVAAGTGAVDRVAVLDHPNYDATAIACVEAAIRAVTFTPPSTAATATYTFSL